MIYLDNAATSYPKPEQVVRAMTEYMVEVGANPGRSAYENAAHAARVVFETRESLAELFGASDSRRIVFTSNATESLNLALFGSLQCGDRVVTTSMEHNAVMRPLRYLQETRDIKVCIVRGDAQGRVDPERIGASVNTSTKLVVINHASNVTGTLNHPAAVRAAIGDLPLLVDAAQTAGVVPIDVEKDGIDLLAFTGHKGLLGPQGTGGLFIREGHEPEPLVFGGTGSLSDSDRQPDFLPDRYEGGTRNAAGIAGLGAAVRLLLSSGVERARGHEMDLFQRLWDGLAKIDGVTLYGTSKSEERTAPISLTIDHMTPSTAAYELDRRYGMAVRSGLHCAPEAHRTLGTFPDGTIRLACGAGTTATEVDTAIQAIDALAQESGR